MNLEKRSSQAQARICFEAKCKNTVSLNYFHLGKYNMTEDPSHHFTTLASF
jgi:hypothetical protein